MTALQVVFPTLEISKHRNLTTVDLAAVSNWRAQRGMTKWVRSYILSIALNHSRINTIERTHHILVHRKLGRVVIVRGCFHSVSSLARPHLLGNLRVQTGHIVFRSSSAAPRLSIASGTGWTIIVLPGLTSSDVGASIHERFSLDLFHGPLGTIAFPANEEVETIINIARPLFLLLELFPLLVLLHSHQRNLNCRTFVGLYFLLQ